MRRAASRGLIAGSPRLAAAAPKKRMLTAASCITRGTSAEPQPSRMGPILMPLGSISILTLLGDNSTWSVTLFCATGDHALKNLRHEEKWTNVVRACPLHAHWLDGQPVTGVLADERDRRSLPPLRRQWIAGGHGASWRWPTRGRARIPRRGGVSPWDSCTPRCCAAWSARRGPIPVRSSKRSTHEPNRTSRPGTMPRSPSIVRGSPTWTHCARVGSRHRRPIRLRRSIRGLFATMMADPDLFRAAIEYIATITPVQRILERPAVTQAINVAFEAMRHMPPPGLPGPNRSQLLELVS